MTAVFLGAVVPAAAWAVDFRITWRPSPSANIQGYNVFVRQATQSYGAPRNAGLPPLSGGTMTYTATGYAEGPHYCVAVSAREAGGGESVRSNEICTCTDDAQCDDGNVCDGLETCSGNTCRPGTPLTCTDTDPCTDDGCDARSGCAFPPIPGCRTCSSAVVCDDGSSCNGTEKCEGGVCTAGNSPTCDDGDPCTDDGCSSSSGCTHDQRQECADCESASALGIRARRITLVQSIYGINMTAVGVLSPARPLDPTSTGVSVQILDASGATLYSASVPAADFTPNKRGTAFRFFRKGPGPEGQEWLRRVRVRNRADGSAVVVTKGKGLQVPSAFPTQLTWILRLADQCGLDTCTALARKSDCEDPEE